MTTFDAHIQRVADQVTELRAMGRPMREFLAPSSVAALTQTLPIRVGAGANPKIILRSDTFVELGEPTAGSCAIVLWTHTPALLRDGRIRLIGPDLPQAPGASLPFGQILLIGGTGLTVDEHQALAQAQYVADQIEGYMVRSSSRNIWSRISTEAAAKGFCFEMLGRALFAIYKTTIPKVQAMEAVFVTSSKDDVLRLNEIARDAHGIAAEIVKEHWKARGYDLDCDLDCRSCHDKDVCDDVRKIIAARLRKERDAAAPEVT